MTKKKVEAAETPAEAREKRDAEARGEGDLVVLTNDSGEVKKLTPEEWEDQHEMLTLKGWRVLGEEA